eukprot:2147981-Rhodomonas_salina.1
MGAGLLSAYALPTPRNQMQEIAFLVQMVLKMRFLVFEFGVYVFSGTDLAYGRYTCAHICLRACYALAGTGLAYGFYNCAPSPAYACYAISGTNQAYACCAMSRTDYALPMPLPVLT